jgi:DNA polymerase III delta prime subunit
MSLLHLSKQNLHHTNICVGNRVDIFADIDTLVSNFSKDVSKIERLTYEFDKFLIKDAQHIFSKHIHKVGEDEMQIITIACNFTNRETQNSMLKLLEEPPRGTYFFLIVPNKKVFLPTILSRAQIFEYKKEIEISKEIQTLIESSYVKRFEFVKKLLDEVKDEKKTKEDVIAYIEQIEKYLHQKKNLKLLKRTIDIKDYLKDQGASMKQLLEYLIVQI